MCESCTQQKCLGYQEGKKYLYNLQFISITLDKFIRSNEFTA